MKKSSTENVDKSVVPHIIFSRKIVGIFNIAQTSLLFDTLVKHIVVPS